MCGISFDTVMLTLCNASIYGLKVGLSPGREAVRPGATCVRPIRGTAKRGSVHAP